MAEAPKKKRDLRARLGRTITPKTGGGGAPAAAPPGAGAGAVPPPSLGGEAPTRPKAGGITPPPSGVAAPPQSLGGGMPGSDVAPPPFAKPAAPAAPRVEQPSDPFAAGVGRETVQQVVRLEFDDKLVSDAEVGKGRTYTVFIVAAVVLAVGLGVGFFGGSTYENNVIFERTVRDAQTIYGEIDGASRTVNAAQGHINAIITSAAGSPAAGEAPAVNYEAIEALRALHKPFDLSAFTSKNYNALPPNTVNDLFTYAMNIQTLWRDIESLAAQALQAARREELDRTAQETAEGANTQYGAVLARTDDGQLMGSLAFLTIQEGEDGAPHVMARGTRGGQGREFQVFSGAEDQEISSAPEFVMLIDGQTSRGVLAEQTGAFGLFLGKIRDLKILIDQTVEVQGRLIQAISQALTEAGASASAPPPTE